MKVNSMPHIRKTALVSLAVVTFGAGWFAKSAAQENPSSPVITYFSHEKVDAALAKGGRLFNRKDNQGTTYSVLAVTRGKSDEGVVHSHEVWTGVVVIMSGAATFITPGAAAQSTRTAVSNEFGGQSIGSGESHRVGKGDVVIIPPGAPHVYRNIEEPFSYMVIQTP
jgi:mannose-6-phosphate isomerase-like protein (cupin superfamily)